MQVRTPAWNIPVDSRTLSHGSPFVVAGVEQFAVAKPKWSGRTSRVRPLCPGSDYRALGSNRRLTFDGWEGGYTRTTGGFEGGLSIRSTFLNALTLVPVKETQI